MKGGLILAIFGAMCLLFSFCGVVVSLLLPALTNNRTDFEEALVGVIGGGCCSSLSFLLILGGIIWMIVGRKPPGPRG